MRRGCRGFFPRFSRAHRLFRSIFARSSSLSGGFGGGRGSSLAGGGCGAVRCGVVTSCRGGAVGCGCALFVAHLLARRAGSIAKKPLSAVPSSAFAARASCGRFAVSRSSSRRDTGESRSRGSCQWWARRVGSIEKRRRRRSSAATPRRGRIAGFARRRVRRAVETRANQKSARTWWACCTGSTAKWRRRPSPAALPRRGQTAGVSLRRARRAAGAQSNREAAGLG
ncbi:hypothetical protein M885DRAFT_256110 [Pelagophyceae sp. CCMP2097]|nr:hypothetical protein M885DRAFT_256110 [Pelagophyceae sp. CCMP2097]